MNRRLSRNSLIELVVFTAGFVVCLVLAYRLNFEEGKPKNPGVFYSDKSIYYVYLPATFINNWDVEKFPSRCDTLYRGFILDTVHGKVKNKMTYGVALLWMPFFLVTHSIAVAYDLKPDGFSDFYQKMAILPPAFYLILGLFFLRRFLAGYFPPGIAYVCILIIFAGTNLYHYGLVEGLMSHVYSFFLFSLYLFLLKKFLDSEMKPFRLFMGICLVVSLAILIRPSNVIILCWLFLLDAKTWKEVVARFVYYARPQHVLTLLGIGFLVFLPQMIYWKYESGSFLHYSYGKEGFDNWNDPVILPVLFSPLNGLFIYTPMMLFFVAGFFLMIFRRIANGFLLLGMFVLVTYVSGSWFMWFFGGSLGSRPYVEYYALFSLGLGYLLMVVHRIKNWFSRSLIYLSIIIFIWVNLKFTHYNPWNTSSVWAWDDFRERLDKAGILHFTRETYTYIQDFENVSVEPSLTVTSAQSHSLNYSALVDSRYQKCNLYDHWMTGILGREIRQVAVSVWVRPVYRSISGEVVATIEDDKGNVWLKKNVVFNQNPDGGDGWSEVALSFEVPRWLNGPENRLKVFIRNEKKQTFYVDDVRIGFE
jgi:hypothetical protein